MRVILLRHGIAHDRADPDCPADPERELTPDGERKTRKVAKGLVALGCAPTRILTSPYRRARETAALAADAFGLDKAKLTLTEALLPEAAPHALYQQLYAFHNSDEEVLCAGHAPNLDKVIALALTGERAPVTALKKAGAALLAVDDLPRTRGTLVWLMPPKVLADLG
ncbi:MAG: phosphohistidine phosphatase SixA [Deltaproteobacteria bacterium]|nr:phosphohistidine phosphatase SixA [Deltaproteobacteria bacterium]